jgi:hypothetical protein
MSGTRKKKQQTLEATLGKLSLGCTWTVFHGHSALLILPRPPAAEGRDKDGQSDEQGGKQGDEQGGEQAQAAPATV